MAGGHRQRGAAAVGQRLRGRHQASVGQDGRRDAPGQIAQLLDGDGGLFAGGPDERGRFGFVGQLGLGPAELHGQRDQTGLGTVMQVAFDPAQFSRLRVDGLTTGAAQGVDPLLQLAGLQLGHLGPKVDECVQAEQEGEAEDRPEHPQAPDIR